MDAFAVSIATSTACKQFNIRHAVRMALFFGGFQAGMPLIGALAGITLKSIIISYDHWVAFGLLSAIGGKMIYDSFKRKSTQDHSGPENIRVLLILSVATSIDALVVGITLPLITSSVVVAVIIIGLVTFALSLLGYRLGQKMGHFFERRIEIIGGLILIAIGAKILLQHLFES